MSVINSLFPIYRPPLHTAQYAPSTWYRGTLCNNQVFSCLLIEALDQKNWIGACNQCYQQGPVFGLLRVKQCSTHNIFFTFVLCHLQEISLTTHVPMSI